MQAADHSTKSTRCCLWDQLICGTAGFPAPKTHAEHCHTLTTPLTYAPHSTVYNLCPYTQQTLRHQGQTKAAFGHEPNRTAPPWQTQPLDSLLHQCNQQKCPGNSVLMSPSKTAASNLSDPRASAASPQNQPKQPGELWAAFLLSAHNTAAHRLNPDHRHVGSPAVPAEAALGVTGQRMVQVAIFKQLSHHHCLGWLQTEYRRRSARLLVDSRQGKCSGHHEVFDAGYKET